MLEEGEKDRDDNDDFEGFSEDDEEYFGELVEDFQGKCSGIESSYLELQTHLSPWLTTGYRG